MLKIRLARIGKRNEPLYRVVVSDHTKTPTAEALEILGNYNPKTDPATLDIKEDRVKYWLGQGVQCSETVGYLLTQKGLMDKKRIEYTSKNPKKSKKEKAKEKEAAENGDDKDQDKPDENKPAEKEKGKPEEKKEEQKEEKSADKPAEKKEDKKPEAKGPQKPAEKKEEKADKK